MEHDDLKTNFVTCMVGINFFIMGGGKFWRGLGVMWGLGACLKVIVHDIDAVSTNIMSQNVDYYNDAINNELPSHAAILVGCTSGVALTTLGISKKQPWVEAFGVAMLEAHCAWYVQHKFLPGSVDLDASDSIESL